MKSPLSPVSLSFVAFLLLAACTPQADQPVTDAPNEPVVEESPNLIQNSAFGSAEGWNHFFLESAEGEGGVSYGEYCLDIGSPGDAAWQIQLIQGGLTLEQGESYTASFEAYANKPLQVRLGLEEDGDDYSSLAEQTFALSNTRTTYELTADISEEAGQSRLNMSTGGELVGTTPVTVCFDDVELRASN